MVRTHPAIAAYYEVVARERSVCDALFKAWRAACDVAYEASPDPAAVRIAVPADIVAGTVLWRRCDERGPEGGRWIWIRVQRVTDPVHGGFVSDGQVSSGYVMPGDSYHDPSGWHVEDVAEDGLSEANGHPDDVGRGQATDPSASRPGPPLHVIAYPRGGTRWEGMVEAGSAPAGWPTGTLHARISAPFGPDVDATLDDVAAADAHEACLAFVSHLTGATPGSGLAMADAYLGFAAKQDWHAAHEVGEQLVDTLADMPEGSGIAAAVAAAHFVAVGPRVGGLEKRVMDALEDLPQDDPDVACMTAFVSMAMHGEIADPRERTIDLMRAAMATLASARPSYSGTVGLLGERFNVVQSILEAERPDGTLRGDLDAATLLLRAVDLGGIRATYADRT